MSSLNASFRWVIGALWVGVLFGGAVPALAADDEIVAVPPLVTDSSRPAINVATVQKRVLDELRAGPEFDEVQAMDEAPLFWGTACLDDLGCLEALAVSGEARHLVAGRVRERLEGPVLELVYLKRGMVDGRVSVPLPSKSADIERNVALAIESLLTGIEIPPHLVGRGPTPTVDEAVPPPKAPPQTETGAPVVATRHCRPRRAETAKPRSVDRPGWRIAVRGGWSRYSVFDFVSGSVELGRRIVGPVFVVGGIDVYAVNRALPPELTTVEGETSIWNALVPVNLGVQLQPQTGTWRPYVGGELVAGVYHRDDDGLHISEGWRGRVGVDWRLGRRVAATVHGAIGVWGDDAWVRVQADAATRGLLTQLGMGLVFGR